jgi:S-adenosylmethionine:tRNA ribosyltransferase-isomerase
MIKNRIGNRKNVSLKEVEKSVIKNYFSNRLLIIDEVHNLRDDNVKENTLHSEYCYLSSKTAKILNKTKKSENNRIICVGTTALRTLETSFENGEFKPINMKTNKFIYPGIDINSIDALITNFHLPKSSLFILICALMGTNKMLNAYNYAIKNKYRFYSYGDACLLEK